MAKLTQTDVVAELTTPLAKEVLVYNGIQAEIFGKVDG